MVVKIAVGKFVTTKPLKSFILTVINTINFIIYFNLLIHFMYCKFIIFIIHYLNFIDFYLFS